LTEGTSLQAAATTTTPTPTLEDDTRSGRWLERALLVAFVLHGIAMLSMALLLLPGIPGGPNADVAARMAYVAGHPWLWRLGWLPWQLTALSDLLVGVALLSTRWVPRLPSILAIVVTLAGIVPDQWGQIRWITQGIALAQAGDLAAYRPFEQDVFAAIAVGGGTGYLLAAIFWSLALARTSAWTRWLTVYSIVLWGLFALLALAPVVPAARRPAPAIVAAGNAVAFVLLLIWFAVVAELVLRRARPDTRYGRYASWRYPRRGPGRLFDVLANSRFVRAFSELLPVPAFRSDITNVIYVNYIVGAYHLEPLVPQGLELQRIGPDGRYAMFSFLAFHHGHFGPRALGPLRRLLPSPLATNWRIYVRNPLSGHQGVFFTSTAINNLAYALGARLLTEGLPMHLLRRGKLSRTPEDAFLLLLDPGKGSGLDAAGLYRAARTTPAFGPWDVCFPNYNAMLAYCVPQNRALSVQPWHRWVTRQEIRLDIPLEACEPLEGELFSQAARAIVGDAMPFAFRVASVNFRFDAERHDRW
jgi:hypothetical protein